ncbi:MAG TPA: glycosyltransferase [Anaerolineae bacterium]|nr:glycosyltransferase [Anaerolineae bacterium]
MTPGSTCRSWRVNAGDGGDVLGRSFVPSSVMRLLILAPQLPWPPNQGTALRNLNLVRVLAARHAVHLVCFGDPFADRGPLPDWGVAVTLVPAPPPRPFLRRLLELPTQPTPDLLRRLASPAMDRCLADLAADPAGQVDVLQVEGIEMAPFGLALRALLARRGRAPRLVYDAHNAEWILQDRAWRADLRRGPAGLPGVLYSLLQTAKLRRYERRLLRAADAVVAVSAADAEVLRALAPGVEPVVVPNGVDTAVYQPGDAASEDPDLVVFTGKMDFRPNIDGMAWFCERVWPLARALRPGLRLAIVGRDPVPRVRTLASAALGIEVTGAVPDVRPFIARAGIIVVPLRVGGGTRLKVLEAMAAGKAIVATRLGAEGLELVDGREALLADEPEAMARAIAALAADGARRAELGRAARARAVRDYRWEGLVEGMEGVYGE